MRTQPPDPATDRPSVAPAVVTGVTVASVLVVLVSTVLLAGDVPEVVVSRWGAGGEPVDTMPLWGLTLVMAAVTGSVGALLGVIARRVGPPSAQRLATGVATGLPPALAVLHVGTLLVAVDQGLGARFPGAAGLLALSVLVGGTVVGYVLAQPVDRPDRPIEPVVLEVASGEAVVWAGRSVAPGWQWAVLGAATLVGVLALWPVSPWLALVLVTVMALGASALVARVTVGPGGLTVRTGPAGLVRMHVPLEAITAADAILVDPLAHGGYGLRLMPGLRGVVFRAGPGLRVEQQDGPTTVVTLDGAAVAVGVLRAHLDSRAADAV